MGIFINSGVNNGIENYLKKVNNHDYEEKYEYEVFVFEILVYIYNKISIVNPYTTNYEKFFINNLKVYGLSNEDTNLFISSLEEYDKYLDDDQINKTNSIYNIQMILIKMILLKNLYKGLSSEELEFYDNHLLLKDQKIRKLLEDSCYNIGETIDFWKRKRNIYINKKTYKFKEIEPDYLTNTMYQRHGVSINQIKQLSNLKVREVNSIICNLEKKKRDNEFNLFKVNLSSGSGRVDTLILFSIVLTEIFIGFLIAVFGR